MSYLRKLKIKRLENTSERQVTYLKRSAEILKKAKELSNIVRH
uniref:MADS34 n=1 Tax=Apostasia odorata TaxID=280455 RepID=A0A1L1WL17_9ASPA|nr:MADS34 [Apostasia odorata]